MKLRRILCLVLAMLSVVGVMGCWGYNDVEATDISTTPEPDVIPVDPRLREKTEEEGRTETKGQEYSGEVAREIQLDWKNDDGFELTASGEVYEPLLMTEDTIYFDDLEIKRLETEKDVYAMPFVLKIKNLTDKYGPADVLLQVRAGYWGLENGMGQTGSVDELLEDDDAAGFVLMGDFAEGIMMDREWLGIKTNAKYGKRYIVLGCIYFVDSKKTPNRRNGKVFDYSEEIKFCGLGVKSFDEIGGYNWKGVVKDADSVYMDKVDGRLVFVN